MPISAAAVAKPPTPGDGQDDSGRCERSVARHSCRLSAVDLWRLTNQIIIHYRADGAILRACHAQMRRISRRRWFRSCTPHGRPGLSPCFIRLRPRLRQSRVGARLQRRSDSPHCCQAPATRGSGAGQGVLAAQLDVDRSEDARAAIDAAMGRFGRIDVLINNAGYGVIGALEETPDAELRAVMETNFFGPMVVIMAGIAGTPCAGLRGDREHVELRWTGCPSLAVGAHSASKFALEGASEALAQELAPFGIKVLIVEPGAFRTGFAARALRHMPVMDVYQEAVSPLRAFACAMDNTQEGDPRRAVEAARGGV